jgi:hypothetical protein
MEYEREEEYNKNERRIEEIMEEFKKEGYKREIIDVSEIEIGEIIIVRYIPYSQRDLYIHKSEMGVYIGDNNMRNIEGEKVMVKKEGLYNDQRGYYSEGYCIVVEKIKK